MKKLHAFALLFSSLYFLRQSHAEDMPSFLNGYFRLKEARYDSKANPAIRGGFLHGDGASVYLSIMDIKTDYTAYVGTRACTETTKWLFISAGNGELKLRLQSMGRECTTDASTASEQVHQVYPEDQEPFIYHYRFDGKTIYLQAPYIIDGKIHYDDSRLLIFEE